MATSTRRFKVTLYEEYLEEASFLYEQHLAYLHDPELTWLDLAAFEDRFDAHIDALVVGDALALEVCKQRCAGGDFGELHAALRVFCREDRQDLAYAVLQRFDYSEPQVTQAVVDAFKAECPPAWQDDLARIMIGRSTQLVPVLAEALAYRRAPIEEALLRVLPNCADAERPRVLRALGTVGGERARAAVTAFLRSEHPAVAAAACRALIRLGEYQAVRHGLLAVQLRGWPAVALGIAGDASAVGVLMEIVKNGAPTDDVLIALGMLGDLRSVNTLFNCLSNPQRAMAAAVGLQIITGAQLCETTFVPDPVDPDELSAEERAHYDATGTVPQRRDGTPFGTNRVQLSVDPPRWRDWLTTNKASFDPKLPHRYGKPLSPRATLDALAAAQTPNRVRALLCEELVVRYRAPVALEVDMPVQEQRRHLAGLAQWVETEGAKFTPGTRYFAGRPMA